MSFDEVKSTLGLSDDNLSAHATSLRMAGYAEIGRTFKECRPHTAMLQNDARQEAFRGYVETLRKIIGKEDEAVDEQE